MSLRILYASNAFWANSGYGVQGRSLLPRLAELPEIGGRENLAMFAWWGLEGGCHNVDGFHVYPKGGDAYGNDVIGVHAQHFRANVVVSLIYVWVMQQTAERVKPAVWLPWFPIDCAPVPDGILRSLEGAYMPLTYSQWGHKLLTERGVENCYIPHGVETTIYKVHDRESVAQFKAEKFGADCEHLTVMVAANKDPMDRKAFAQNIAAWAKFADGKPGCKLYLHTEPTARFGGVDLSGIVRELGIAERVYFPNQYEYGVIGMSAEYLSYVYNAADVLLAASKSEGFGIPIIEAQACGTPVITTNYASMPELVRWGQVVEPIDRLWTPLNSWWAVPGTDEIAAALESLYEQWSDNGGEWSTRLMEMTSREIHHNYSWDKIVTDYWGPLMAKVAEAIDPPPVTMAVPVGPRKPGPRAAALESRIKSVVPEMIEAVAA